MKLSTKGRYAMVALADLAMQAPGALLSLAEISKRQDISLPYLEQLFVKLRRAGLVESVSANVYVFLHQTRLSDVIENDLAPCPAVPTLFSVVDE